MRRKRGKSRDYDRDKSPSERREETEEREERKEKKRR
jgi:hypothetical protein